MKIRIKGDSIRIRLTKTEVAKFGSEGHLEEKTNFATGAFTYILKSSEAINELSAGIEGATVTMYVPAAMTKEWTTTDIVGYNNNMPLGNGNSLFLLLEKDFKCIDGEVLEDQSDNYENPLHSCE
jgi:hypothetical protein